MITAEKLAAFGINPGEEQKANVRGPDFDMEAYVIKHGVEVIHRKPWQSHPGGKIFELARCPFSPEHIDGSAAFSLLDGVPGFTCQHHGCHDKTIKDVFNKYPPLRSNTNHDSDKATRPKSPRIPSFVWCHNLVGHYLKIVGPCTEAPDEYHIGCLLTVVGLLIGRKCWVSLPHATFPNLYTVLLGGTGDSRKTTAWRYAVKLLEEVSERLNENVKRLHGLSSIEGLAAAMKDGHRVLAIEDEFRALTTKAHQKATSNLIPRLTELYNTLASFEVNTKTDPIAIKEPFLSILSSSTEEWFRDSLGESDIGGGFLNRWTLFSGRAEKLIPFPEPGNTEDWHALVVELSDLIKKAQGNYTMTQSAKDIFSEFYSAFRKRNLSGAVCEATARVHTHAMKFALLFAVMSGHCQIEEDDMESGIALASYCGAVVEGIAPTIGRTKAKASEQKLLAMLRGGKKNTRQLLRGLNCDASELDRTANALVRVGIITISRETSGAGRPQTWLEFAD